MCSRAAFGGESERAVLASVLDAHLPKGHLKWLEVGIGNGSNLTYLLRALGRERQFDVVAMDPQSFPAAGAFAEWPISFHRTKLEDLTLAGSYDCINLRQSCYYLDCPADSMVRLADALSTGGILAVTLWAPDCALRALYRTIAGAAASVDCGLTADDLLGALSGERFQVLSRRQISADLNVDLIQRDARVAAALVALAARKLDIAGMSEDDRADLCHSFLAGRTRLSRINEILLVGRRPQPIHFDTRSMISA